MPPAHVPHRGDSPGRSRIPFAGGGTLSLVVTYGTFDELHIGHLRLLERARALGSGLAVGVATDEFSMSRGIVPVVPFEERCELVSGLACVDEVFSEQSWEQKAPDIVR